MAKWTTVASRAGCIVWMFVMIFCLFFDLSDGGCHPRVKTRVGRIHGKYVTFNDVKVSAYLGIPFAEPPVGKLRFKKAQPIRGGKCGKIVAQTLPPACIQLTSPPPPKPWSDIFPGKTEDCLYLNVWSPSKKRSKYSEKRAVLFWIHGGGFRFGSTRVDIYDGRVLAALGDVVVVTANHRLGPQGFLYTSTHNFDENMGMYDLVEALSWVRNNIGRFGGDPDQVTVFGQSTGSISVAMLMASPLARGLFQRAILQSGAATNLVFDDNALDGMLTLAAAQRVGCVEEGSTPDDIDRCLLGVDGLELAKAVADAIGWTQWGLTPRYGNEFLPISSRMAYSTGEFHGVDVLIGVNSAEGALLPLPELADLFGPDGQDPHISKTVGEGKLRRNFETFDGLDAIVERFLGGLAEDDYMNVKKQVYTAIGDFNIVCPVVYTAESLAKQGRRVSFYMFDHMPSNSRLPSWVDGATHFDEVAFVFGMPVRYPCRYTNKEVDLSKRLVRMWARFAKTGIAQKSWPEYSIDNPIYLTLDTNKSATGYGPQHENCDFYRRYFGF